MKIKLIHYKQLWKEKMVTGMYFRANIYNFEKKDNFFIF